MNRNQYRQIKESLNLEPDSKFLGNYAFQTTLLLAPFFYISFELAPSCRFLAIPLISLFMFRSFAFMHEAVHGLLSENRRINQFLGRLSGTFCLLSFDSWQRAHLEHHRWSGNIDKDPVAAMIKTFPTFPKSLQSILTFGWRCWIPTLSLLQHTVFWAITLRGRIGSAIFPVIFWIALLTALPGGFILSVLLPSVIVYLIGTEVINAPHHLGLDYFRGEIKIPAWEQYKTARTCIYPKWLARFAVLNFNYHVEHHMYPYVPWYHLDKLHLPIHAILKDKHNLDPSFSWILENRPRHLKEVFGSQQLK